MARFDLRDLFRGRTPRERIDALHLRPDLARAAVLLVADERTDAQVARLEPLLTPEESVVMLVEGRFLRQMGLLVLSDRRVVFKPHGDVSTGVRVLPLPEVTDVASAIGTMTGRVVLRSAGTAMEVDKLLGRLAEQFAAAVLAQQQTAEETAAPGAPPRDPLQELVDLRERYTAGMIGSDAYEAAKARLVREL